jgi:phosphatidylglycerophosphate synthase
MRKSEAIIYVPSDTPEAMMMATRKVAGVPLIVRSIMTLAGVGIKRVSLLIAKTQREAIESFLKKFPESKLPRMDFIPYDEPYRVSPEMVAKVEELIGEKTLLINSNLIIDANFAKALINEPLQSAQVITASDGYHSLPAFIITKSIWKSLTLFTSNGSRSIQSCLTHIKTVAPQKKMAKPVDSSSFLVSRYRDKAVAEKYLSEAIRHATTGPVARFLNKRISLPISIFLSKLWISPNAITAFNIIIGVFSGVFIADGNNYWAILFGATLFQAASIIDGCDGEVAKLTFRGSKFGQYIDTISDNLSLASVLIGLMAGYWRHTHSPIAFVIGGIVILCAIIIVYWMMRWLKQNTNSFSLVTYDTEFLQKLTGQPKLLMLYIKYGKFTLKKDFFSFLVFVFALANIMYWWIYLTAIGAVSGAIILTYLSLQEMWQKSPKRVLKEARAEGIPS